MLKKEYEIMYRLEKTYWWYQSLHELVEWVIKGLNLKSLCILDAGCGTGAMSEILSKYGNVECIDFAPEAIEFCRLRGLDNTVLGDLNEWIGKQNYYDVIVCLDVLYHRAIINDDEIVRKFYASLKEKGMLVLNLPAYDFLNREHDIAVGGARRYTKNNVVHTLTNIGFSISIITYRLPLLFLFLAIRKLTEIPSRHLKYDAFSGHTDPESDLKPLPSFINTILLLMTRLEYLLIRQRIFMPFGSSLFVVARKQT